MTDWLTGFRNLLRAVMFKLSSSQCYRLPPTRLTCDSEGTLRLSVQQSCRERTAYFIPRLTSGTDRLGFLRNDRLGHGSISTYEAKLPTVLGVNSHLVPLLALERGADQVTCANHNYPIT